MAYDQQALARLTTSTTEQRRPKAVDLFCGIGGMGLGFEQAGFDVVVGVELDPLLAAIHAFNHPSTRVVCGNVASLVGASREKLGLQATDVDVVFGGPPCQGFSLIGKRRVDDTRNDLVEAFIKVATELSPRYIVMENVEGILQPAMKVHVDRAKALLAAADYSFAEPKTIDACEFGVPQRRRRVFLIAWRSGESSFEWPNETHGNGNSGRQAFVTVKDAIGDLGSAVRKTKSPYAQSLGPRTIIGCAAPRTGVPAGLSGLQPTAHNQFTVARFTRTEGGKEEPVSRYTRLSWNGLCHTMRAGTGPDRGSFMSARPIHPGDPRVVTVREAARLHGYPDWFQFHRTKWHSFRGIGNSVPPPMARAIALSLVTALGATPAMAPSIKVGDPGLLDFDPRRAAEHFGVEFSMGTRVRKSAA